MTYESLQIVASEVAEGVSFVIAKMSYSRRVELMRKVRDLARELEFLEAGSTPADQMDAALVEAEINRLHLIWGLQSISGLTLDGLDATPIMLAENGPEELFREALAAVRKQTGLTESERKN